MSGTWQATADERQILAVLAAANGPLPSPQIANRVNPFPFGQVGDTRRRIMAWGRRNADLRDAETRLLQLGLIVGEFTTREIAPAGREELARATETGGGES